jgi:hypothetical protein
VLFGPSAKKEEKNSYFQKYISLVQKKVEKDFRMNGGKIGLLISLSLSWASADFFQGGGQNILFVQKQRKTYYFSQKSSKTYYFLPALAGRGGWGKSPPCPPPSGRP